MSKTILITGATSGIGESTSEYLSKQGYETVLVGRNEEKLNDLKQKLKGVKVIYKIDLTEINQIETMFMSLKDNGIVFDGLVYCAGIGMDRTVRMCETIHLEKLMMIHYYSFVEVCRLFSQKKYSNNGASIVTMSSISPVVSKKGSLPYSSAKAAMDNAVNVMAKEFIKRKIRVNAIQPALVNTPLTQNAEGVLDIESIQPLGYIEPEYISFLVEFLLSDKSKYMTGNHIPITAGMEL